MKQSNEPFHSQLYPVPQDIKDYNLRILFELFKKRINEIMGYTIDISLIGSIITVNDEDYDGDFHETAHCIQE